MTLTMKPTGIKGAWIGQFLSKEDERGYFSRMFCTDELRDYLPSKHKTIENINTSFNFKSATLRGIHYQVGESSEPRLFTVLLAVSSMLQWTCAETQLLS